MVKLHTEMHPFFLSNLTESVIEEISFVMEPMGIPIGYTEQRNGFVIEILLLSICVQEANQRNRTGLNDLFSPGFIMLKTWGH